MNNRLLRAGATAILVVALSACAHESSRAMSAADHVSNIMKWWSGDYNNDVQLDRLTAQGKPVWREDGSGKGGHIAVTSHYRHVDLPAFGDNVIYVEETKHRDPDNMFRQRIYTLSVIQETQQVRVKLWYFNDKKKYVGAWMDLTKLDGISPGEMFPLQDECDLLVTRVKGKYHMPMAEKACVFGERYFSYQVLLGPDSFWFRDKINSVADDALLESAGGFTYHELDKLR